MGHTAAIQRNAWRGEFRISTFTKIESVPDAIQTSIAEIRRLQTEPPTVDELENTKAYTLGSFVGKHETPQSLDGDLWLIESEGLAADYFKNLLAGVQETSAEACTAFAQDTLDAEKLVIVVVGPAETLKEKLEAIAPVTVVPRKSTKAEK